MRRNMLPCWSCGAENEPCYDSCDCAKCIDPEGYKIWKEENPDEYEEWLDENSEE